MFLLKFIFQSQFPSFNIFNVYCLPGARDGSCFQELIQTDLPLSPMLVIGDFNFQHPSQGSPISKLFLKAKDLCLYFSSQDLFCINVFGVKTCILPNSAHSFSIIDLSLVNPSLADLLHSFSWEVYTDFSLNSSDYLFIEINFSFLSFSFLSSSVPNDWFSFNFVNNKIWLEHFDKFFSSLNFIPPHFSKDIDNLALTLHKSFLNIFSSIQSFILNKNSSKRSPSLSSLFYYQKNDWWNDKFQKAHNELSSFLSSDPFYSSHRFAYKQLVSKTKKEHFKKIIEKCIENNIWSLQSWCTKPCKNSFLPSINFLSGPATLPQEIAQGFINEFFSSFNISPIFSSLFLNSPLLNPKDFSPITMNKINNTLKPTSNSSVLGCSQISYKFIKFSLPHIFSFLVPFFNSILNFSYHSLLWCQALIVVHSQT